MMFRQKSRRQAGGIVKIRPYIFWAAFGILFLLMPVCFSGIVLGAVEKPEAAAAQMPVLGNQASKTNPGEPAKQPDTLHPSLAIGLTQFPANFHPGVDAMAAKSYILGFARQPFTTYDHHWQPVCLLCTELPSRENGRVTDATLPDGTPTLDVRYTIKPEAKWADGVDITAHDVVFSWQVGKHPLSGYASSDLYVRDIAEIKAIDDKNFVVRLGRMQCQYALINDFVLLPAHIEQKIFEADPAQYRLHTAYETDRLNPGLYNGPYRITSIADGVSVTFGRNPYWAGKSPQFDQIKIKAIENTSALEANLLSHQIDMVAGEVGLSLEQALALQKRHGNAYQFIFKPGLTYEHVTLNLSEEKFKDPQVRKALLLAIDRAQISRVLFGNQQPVAATIVHPLDKWHAALAPLPYAPLQAAQILDKAGWKMGADGVREKGGEPLAFTCSTTAGNRTRELVQQILLAEWQKIGIKVRLKNQPARVLFGQSLDKRHYDSALFAWMSAPESAPRSLYHSSMIPQESNGYAGQNFGGYNNPKMDKLLDDLDKFCTPQDQTRLWTEMQELYVAELPELPLYYRSDSYILPIGFSGLAPTGHQYPSSLWAQDWKWN